MSRARMIVVAAAIAIVAGLMVWQLVLDRRVAACRESGGEWHGPLAKCMPGLEPTILERGIKRS